MSRHILFLAVAAALQGTTTAFIRGNQEFSSNNCQGMANKVDWIIQNKNKDWSADNCKNLAATGCTADQAVLTNFGANSTWMPCIDPEGNNPDRVNGDFFPEGANGGTFAILTEYDNSIGAERCKTIKNKDSTTDNWVRTARLADGQCRDAGPQRYMRLSCQKDGSVYIRDYCNSTCGNCKYNSMVGYAGSSTCGEIGDNSGASSIVGGYCVTASKGGFPSEKPKRGWKPPNPTGPDQFVTAAAVQSSALMGTLMGAMLLAIVSII
ncbi:uncharacterized protein SPPG_02587 [Spizellomyces punctatus DAOM BR117]|uniref:Uncharacterized protein n=1 Tax=Spizellomyces punctatus (strain DAOM BR117) TaxID=645134 RepID=A0A0L0HKY7_SPIPD|nr:uncharacterized protein SPPG_02587 [Spizellomyces punctatus DAOM BR117]KND02086.1 hypothetical protein SPPG_02587 [Spizellomyces punctatus DAOM BR117]|eukprot:XP_016610125.1 hypothetical protein SPPG_02587 [Spizellomyces punctatus DAOM BR117]